VPFQQSRHGDGPILLAPKHELLDKQTASPDGFNIL
jgi:hypothetical protein